MFERILVPIDGSQTTDAVVEKAVSFVGGDESVVHSIYVIDNRTLIPLGEDEQGTVAESLKGVGETALQSMATTLEAKAPDLEVATNVLQGIPASQILAYANENDIDVIVLGSHGQTMRNQAIGSTTERVVRGVNQISDTLVVVVPIGQDGGEQATGTDIAERTSDMFQ